MWVLLRFKIDMYHANGANIAPISSDLISLNCSHIDEVYSSFLWACYFIHVPQSISALAVHGITFNNYVCVLLYPFLEFFALKTLKSCCTFVIVFLLYMSSTAGLVSRNHMNKTLFAVFVRLIALFRLFWIL